MGSTILSINSNVPAMRAQRKLAEASDSLSSTYARLSSGVRINTPSDDAAALAVASSLKADTRIYTQGIRNLNDGISALNIADGAISNLSDIVIRLQELSEQSANGTFGFKQRKSIDAEAQALAGEYFRLVQTTDFNGLHLLNGSVQNFSLQAGYGVSGSVISTVGGSLGTGTFGAAGTYTASGGYGFTAGTVAGDLNGDGNQDIVSGGEGASVLAEVTVNLGNGDGTFRDPGRITFGAWAFLSRVALGDINRDGNLDLLVSYGTAVNTCIGNGDGTFKAPASWGVDDFATSFSVSDVNNDGTLDLVTAGRTSTGSAVGVRLGAGDGTFSSAVSYQAISGALKNTYDMPVGDLNGDGNLDIVVGINTDLAVLIGNGDGSFKAASQITSAATKMGVTLADFNNDGKLDIGSAGASTASIYLGNGDGNFNAPVTYTIEATTTRDIVGGDLDGDGNIDIVTAGSKSGAGACTVSLGNGNGTFKASTTYLTNSDTTYTAALSDLNGDGVLDLLSNSDLISSVSLGNTRSGVAPLLPFSLQTRADALQAMSMFKRTLERLALQRGTIGAFESRIHAALSTLQSTTLEYSAANSRMEDADIAQESASLVRLQILQNSAAGILAQTSQAPAIALTLLRV